MSDDSLAVFVISEIAPFEEETGASIDYAGSRDFETQIRVSAEGGDLPDIGVFPQPGLLRDVADAVVPVAADVLSEAEANFDPYLFELVTVATLVLGLILLLDWLTRFVTGRGRLTINLLQSWARRRQGGLA